MSPDDGDGILRPGAARRRREAEQAKEPSPDIPVEPHDDPEPTGLADQAGDEAEADADASVIDDGDAAPEAVGQADDAALDAEDDAPEDDAAEDDAAGGVAGEDEVAEDGLAEDEVAEDGDVEDEVDEAEWSDDDDQALVDEGEEEWLAVEEDEARVAALGAGGRRLHRREQKGTAEPAGWTAPFRRLYRGETRFDFVGRRRLWFTISAVIILAGLVSLGVRGLNLGIDFKGGTQWQILAPGVTQTQALDAVEAAGLNQPVVEVLGGRTIAVQADLNSLSNHEQLVQTNAVSKALANLAHTSTNEVSIQNVGPTWGSEVTKRALEGLIVFFIVVGIYISFRFEPKMALAAFIAMIHDLLITIGVYSLAGFQVTPDTVIAVLTILGYSLYDTVVVFDRIRDNARGAAMATGRMTYSDMVNLSMNQTLARSINTSLVAILPVLSVLIVGAYILGATTLENYGLALTVGLLSGAYSSIFIASPVLAMMKEREPRFAAIRRRLETRSDRYGILSPAAAAALSVAGSNRPPPVPPRASRPPTAAAPTNGRAATATLEADQTPATPAAPAAATRPPAKRPPARPRKGSSRSKGAKRRR